MAYEDMITRSRSSVPRCLRGEYRHNLRDLEHQIEQLRALRMAGDLSDATRRQLHALELRKQAIEDRLDEGKRHHHLPESYRVL